MKTKRCPNCDTSTVTEGRFLRYSGSPVYGGLRFQPAGMRLFSFQWLWRSGVAITGGVHCCLSCGHLWSNVDAKQLRSYIERCGDQDAKGNLEPFEKSPSDQELA
jgi:hypothetical protein